MHLHIDIDKKNKENLKKNFFSQLNISHVKSKMKIKEHVYFLLNSLNYVLITFTAVASGGQRMEKDKKREKPYVLNKNWKITPDATRYL